MNLAEDTDEILRYLDSHPTATMIEVREHFNQTEIWVIDRLYLFRLSIEVKQRLFANTIPVLEAYKSARVFS